MWEAGAGVGTAVLSTAGPGQPGEMRLGREENGASGGEGWLRVPVQGGGGAPAQTGTQGPWLPLATLQASILHPEDVPPGARWRLRVCSDIYRAHTCAPLGSGAEPKVVGRTETLGACRAWGKHRVLGVPGQALTIKWALRRLPGGSRCLGRAWNG